MRELTVGRWLKTVLLWGGVSLTAVLLARMLNGHGAGLQQDGRFMMDTYVTITAAGPAASTAEAVTAALDRMQAIAVKFNSLDPQSPLYAFNHDGTPVTDPEILKLIRTGLEISRASGGAFDMTLQPVSDLWGFYGKDPHLPPDTDIRKALADVGYQHLILKEGRLTKDLPGARIDLGGIAKGYALIEAARVLKAHGVRSAMINGGGDVYVIGRKGTRPWNIGIQQPRGEGIAGYVPVEDSAVMGSGDYQRFFIKDGKRYHHIFDPRTGYPTEGVASVTLIYPDPVASQAWGKIPFVLGPEKGLAMLEKIPGMKAVIILSSGEKLFSAGGRELFKTETEDIR